MSVIYIYNEGSTRAIVADTKAKAKKWVKDYVKREGIQIDDDYSVDEDYMAGFGDGGRYEIEIMKGERI